MSWNLIPNIINQKTLQDWKIKTKKKFSYKRYLLDSIVQCSMFCVSSCWFVRWTADFKRADEGFQEKRHTYINFGMSNTLFSFHFSLNNTQNFQNTLHTLQLASLKMPRCFMAKKLKYPYEQWKQGQELQDTKSRSPSPISDMDSDSDLARSNQLASQISGSGSNSESKNSKSILCMIPSMI